MVEADYDIKCSDQHSSMTQSFLRTAAELMFSEITEACAGGENHDSHYPLHCQRQTYVKKIVWKVSSITLV